MILNIYNHFAVSYKWSMQRYKKMHPLQCDSEFYFLVTAKDRYLLMMDKLYQMAFKLLSILMSITKSIRYKRISPFFGDNISFTFILSSKKGSIIFHFSLF